MVVGLIGAAQYFLELFSKPHIHIPDEAEITRHLQEVEAARGVIAAGTYHFLALTQDGSLFGWGSNRNMELGLIAQPADYNNAQDVHDSTWSGAWKIASANLPTRLPNKNPFQSVFSGTHASYAIDKEGLAWRHPHPDMEMNGDPLSIKALMEKNFSMFALFDPVLRWSNIRQTWRVSAGIDVDGTLRFWDEEALSTADILQSSHTIVFYLPKPALKWRDLCIDNNNIWAVASDGSLWKHTGRPRFPRSQQSIESAVSAFAVDFFRLDVPAQFRRVVCRDNSLDVLLLDTENNLWGFGMNYNGELGDGDGNQFTNPSAVPKSQIKKLTDKKWADIAIGASPAFTIGIAADGSLWGWGYHIGGGGNHDIPTLIDDKHAWIAVAASREAAAALNDKGELYAWGKGGLGILGDGGVASQRATPTKVLGNFLWGRKPQPKPYAESDARPLQPEAIIHKILERDIPASGLACMSELFSFPYSTRAAGQPGKTLIPCDRCEDLMRAGFLTRNVSEYPDEPLGRQETDTRYELTEQGKQAYFERAGETSNPQYGRICLGKARLFRIDSISSPLRLGSETAYRVTYTIELAAPHPAAFTDQKKILGIDLPLLGNPALYPPKTAAVIVSNGDGYVDEGFHFGAPWEKTGK